MKTSAGIATHCATDGTTAGAARPGAVIDWGRRHAGPNIRRRSSADPARAASFSATPPPAPAFPRRRRAARAVRGRRSRVAPSPGWLRDPRVRCVPQPLVAGEQERLGLGVVPLAEKALAQEALDKDGRVALRETTGPLSQQSFKALRRCDSASAYFFSSSRLLPSRCRTMETAG